MNPLTIDDQIQRQIQKGCISGNDIIKRFLKTSSYYTINYSYEKYLFHNGSLKAFKIQDYEWLVKTNERVAKESLSIILRLERIIRNRIADLYSFFCIDNNYNYFTVESLIVDSNDFSNAETTEEINKIKIKFIDDCLKLYQKKKNTLHNNYHFDCITDVPPFVIAQHLSFGHIRTFFKLLHKSLKEIIVAEFNMKISEFNYLIEKLNYLRNACAHGDFILDFQTVKGKRFSNNKYHKYAYCDSFILDKNKISLLPILSQCAYILHDDIKFFISVFRNILEITNYSGKGSINKDYLLETIGLKTTCKAAQEKFK